MPTQAKQVLYSPVDIDDADFSSYAPELSEDEKEFQKFKDEFKQANEYAKVSCYRQPTTSDGRPGQKQLTFLFEAGVEEFSFSQLAGRLRDEYGSGTYRIQLRDKDGQLKMNRAIAIEAPKTDVVANPTGDLIDRFSRAMQEQQERTENMFRHLVGPQSGGDAFDQMTKMMAAMGSMMGAMGISPQPPQAPKTLVEQLTEYKMLKELFAGDGDGEGGEHNLYSLLGETVKTFGGPIAAALAQASQTGAIDEHGISTQKRLEAPSKTEVDKMHEREASKLEMRKNINTLIQNAKMKVPPVTFAKILVSSTPEDKEDALWDFISDDNCVAAIIELEPAAAHYKDWFEALRDAVMDIMADPEVASHEDAAKENAAGGLSDDQDGAKIAPNPDAVAGVDDTTDAEQPDNSDPTADS